MFPAETLQLIITISRQPKNLRPCYCGRDAIALTSPISDTDGDSVEDTQTSLTEEIRTSLIDARGADVLRPASLSTMLGMTGRLTFRPPSAIILRILYMYIYRYLNNFKKIEIKLSFKLHQWLYHIYIHYGLNTLYTNKSKTSVISCIFDI